MADTKADEKPPAQPIERTYKGEKVLEIPQQPVPVAEGYVGNLTSEQEAKLKEMWLVFLDVIEKAHGAGTGAQKQELPSDEVDKDADKANADPKNAGIAKDDKAKERQQQAEEQAALSALQKEYGPEALRSAVWQFVKGDHPDSSMLRFLRARKWDVSRAVAMLAACMHWRLNNDVESLVEMGELGAGEKMTHFLTQMRSGKTYSNGSSLNEQPMIYIHVKIHQLWGQPQAQLQKYVIFAVETARLLMCPPSDKVVLFFDLTGFGLKNMDFPCVLFIVKVLSSYYPESLGTFYIHNAPYIFKPIWAILRPLLDPVVREKVVFTSKPQDFAKHVPASRLVSSIGGDMVTEFEYTEPDPHENDLQKDTEERKKRFDHYMSLAQEFEHVTREWAKGGASEETIKKRKLLILQLRVAQFELEPYTRGKTVAHRQGVLDGQGKVTWRYEQKDGSVQIHIVGRRTCAATLRREIKEIESGTNPEEAAKRSEKALAERDWIALYGEEKIARELEGDDVKQSASEQPSAPAAAATSQEPDSKEAEKTEAGAAENKEAVASNGKSAKKPAETSAAAEPAQQVNGTEAAEAPSTDEQGSDSKIGTLGKRFSKLMGKATA
ncbi:Phosphatidylinositol transfer protein PDR16 and related proteins [Ceraceosorus bombacis]|uniref:Phosphatidylinositol transfer protein PDR16 and related proteins n=1 Tax=Ceraceosorus bombacis TaxID=401625 RepID=A0A0P1BD57_9BASI|nr:Phosphatidylinositol transfer protein PDR16 and related proteins [Ceraceosorus bombacis]